MIEDQPCSYGNDDDLGDVNNHTPKINCHVLTGQEFHHQWSHQRSQQRSQGRQCNRQSNIGTCEIRHHIWRQATGTTTDQYDTRSNFWREWKNFGQPPADKRHNWKLGDHTYKHTLGHLHHSTKIFYAQRGAHTKHNDLHERDEKPWKLKIADLNKILWIIHWCTYSCKDHDGKCIPL